MNARFTLFLSPDTQLAFGAFLESVFESNTKQTCEAVMLPEAKEPINVRIEALVSNEGEDCRVAVIDLTESRRANDLDQAAKRDRHIAEVLQHTLVPSHTPEQPAGYEIATRYQPALHEAEICGDFYDCFRTTDGRFGVVIGDILGKGLKASAQVAAVRYTVRSYAFLDDQPANVMMHVNEALSRDNVTEDNMMTVFFAVLDPHTGKLAYTNAGHEPPLLMHSDGSIEYLTTGGMMFCGIDKQVYEERKLILKAGDVLVMVTDGITESRKDGTLDFFGAEGIIRCLSNNANASAEDIASKLLEDAMSFADGTPRDDVAIVVIKKLG